MNENIPLQNPKQERHYKKMIIVVTSLILLIIVIGVITKIITSRADRRQAREEALRQEYETEQLTKAQNFFKEYPEVMSETTEEDIKKQADFFKNYQEFTRAEITEEEFAAYQKELAELKNMQDDAYNEWKSSKTP